MKPPGASSPPDGKVGGARRQKRGDALKRAHSLVDHTDIDAVDFLSRDQDWKEARRGRLTCLACGAAASFRVAAAKRSPTFAARHPRVARVEALVTRTVLRRMTYWGEHMGPDVS
jgi:hypothetical protein